MKFTKLVFTAALAILVSFTSFAATGSTDEPSTSGIKKMIQKLDLKFQNLEDESVMVKFMVNDNDEIIILSTDESKLDDTLKRALSYKKLKNSEFKPYKIYVLPIRFDESK